MSTPAKKLPDDVQASVDEANRIEAQLRALQAGEPIGDESEPTPEPEPEETTLEEPPAEEPEPEPAPTVIDPDIDFRQRYLSLQGQFAERDRRIATLEAQLSAATEAREARARREEGAQPGLSDSDVSDYGQEMVDFARRAARDAVKDDLDALQRRNDELEQRLAGTTSTFEQAAKASYFTTMDNDFPQWRVLNENVGFLNWVGGIDLLSGQQRQVLLNQAVGDRNAPRTIAIFRSYLSEQEAVTGMVTPTPAPPAPGTTPESAPVARPGVVPLEALAGPGAGSGSGTDGSSQEGVKAWTQSQIGKFYDDARKGKYKHHPDRYAAIEREIQDAIRANRVTDS